MRPLSLCCLLIGLAATTLRLDAQIKKDFFLVAHSRQQGEIWAYTLTKPPSQWLQPGFDDEDWKRSQGGFGRRGTPGAVVRTKWTSKDIWLRKTFTLSEVPKQLLLDIHHDEDAQVYLNGKLIFEGESYLHRYKRIPLDSSAAALLKKGKNVLAVHCRQTIGGQYIDVGLAAVSSATVVKNKKLADPKSPEAIAFFEKDVLPVLEENCFKCHGGKKRVRGGLHLTSRNGVLKGGDTGPAVDLENPGQSLLLKMINYADDNHKMPPYKKLPQPQIDVLTMWVRSGLPWTPGKDDPNIAKEKDPDLITEEAKNYWAYKKPIRPAVPSVKNKKWVTNPIDAFLLDKLEAKGLKPAPPATRPQLIRRVTYDLIGLPPTLKEVEAFVNDDSPDAYANLIDRLLSSPHYGEKWGRHWLDLVRYAETCGYEYDEAKPFAWRYRDYVIEAFNSDKPYDRFIIEQLAGDEIDNPTPASIVATGYYRLGVFDTHPADPLQRDFDMYDDLVSTTGQVMLGMTLGCARCHDHKKDPIPQEDYYRFLAFLRNIKPAGVGKSAMQPLPNGKEALAVTEYGANPRKTHVLVRGSPHAKRKTVSPGFPQVLGFPNPELPSKGEGDTAGRRLILAKWIANKENPLTARVMVNRIWQHHFGRGIVPSPNDFGKLGERPTHRELLDWLAVEFMERGWSFKAMHKLMMLSSAYQMSSQNDPAAAKVDPNNELFWRFNMRRLTAEEIRDSILAVDGTLDKKIGGPSVYPELPIEVIRTSSKFDRKTGFIGGGFWQRPKPEYEVRRTIYTFVRRSLLPPMLASLDLADTDSSCPVRFTTTVPTQALTMLNSKFMTDHAKLFASRLKREVGDVPRDQVKLALELVTQRPPTEKEIARGVKLIQELRREGISEERALQHFCLVALNLNEFVYVD